jgi:hypothetical protein
MPSGQIAQFKKVVVVMLTLDCRLEMIMEGCIKQKAVIVLLMFPLSLKTGMSI